MRRQSCFHRLEEEVDSYRTVLKTVNVMIRLAESDPDYLGVNELELRTLRALPPELHDVYFARMFACFESDLRHYWRAMGRKTKPPTEPLVAWVAARRQIPQQVVEAVQKVREFRNHLIHEQHEFRQPIPIDDALRSLRTYLSWLPLEW
jgi:hypothetical protein